MKNDTVHVHLHSRPLTLHTTPARLHFVMSFSGQDFVCLSIRMYQWFTLSRRNKNLLISHWLILMCLHATCRCLLDRFGGCVRFAKCISYLNYAEVSQRWYCPGKIIFISLKRNVVSVLLWRMIAGSAQQYAFVVTSDDWSLVFFILEPAECDSICTFVIVNASIFVLLY
jgi:hypothetical protein